MMNKEISCYIVSDLLPLYQEDILSEETKKDIEKHLNECKECRKKLDAIEVQINVKANSVILKKNPLKKVKFYQKVLTTLGAFMAFVFGACCPIIRLGIGVLVRGEITNFQIERLKALWYLLMLECCFIGVITCVAYFFLIWFIRKIISKKTV